MIDIFLVHDGELFELRIRGPVTSECAQSVAHAIGYLPDGCTAIIDLTDVPAIDREGAHAIHRGLLEGRRSAPAIVVVATDVQVRAALVSIDVDHLVPVLPSLELARQAVLAVPAA